LIIASSSRRCTGSSSTTRIRALIRPPKLRKCAVSGHSGGRLLRESESLRRWRPVSPQVLAGVR
jgi:hypothetical protein